MASDKHICFMCNQTIEGLDNYVRHRQDQCNSQKNNGDNIMTEVTNSLSFIENASDEVVQYVDNNLSIENCVMYYEGDKHCIATNGKSDVVIKSEPMVIVSLAKGNLNTVEESSLLLTPPINFDLLFDVEVQEELDKLDFKSFFNSLQLKSKSDSGKKNERDISLADGSLIYENFSQSLELSDSPSQFLSKRSEKQKEILDILEQCKTADLCSMFTDFDFDSDTDNGFSSVLDDNQHYINQHDNIDGITQPFLFPEKSETMLNFLHFEKYSNLETVRNESVSKSKTTSEYIQQNHDKSLQDGSGRQVVTRLSTRIRKPSSRYLYEETELPSPRKSCCIKDSCASTEPTSSIAASKRNNKSGTLPISSKSNNSSIAASNNNNNINNYSNSCSSNNSSNDTSSITNTNNANNSICNSQKVTLPSTSLKCSICKKSFCSKYSLASHISSPLHTRRVEQLGCQNSGISSAKVDLAVKDMETLLLRLKPYQCRPCGYYSENDIDLESHVAADENHAEKIRNLVGPLICVRCQFPCSLNKMMVEHLSSEGHKKSMEKSSSTGKPSCILKESRYKVVCVVCSNLFHSASQLLAHLKTSCWSRARRSKENQTGNNPSAPLATSGQSPTFQSLNVTPDLDPGQQVGATHSTPKRKRGRPPKSPYKKSDIGAGCGGWQSTIDENSSQPEPPYDLNNGHELEVLEAEDTGNEYQGENDSVKVGSSGNKSLIKKPRLKRSRKVSFEFSQDISLEKVKTEEMEEIVLKQENDLDESVAGITMAGEGEERFWCEICGLGFFSQEKLKTHRNARTHVRKIEEMKSGDGQNYRCERCGRLFYAMNALQFHEINHQLADAKLSGKNTGDGVKKDGITVSEEADSRCLALYRQLKSGDDDKNRKVLCPECGKMLTKAGILSHLRQHTGSLPYKCTFCLKQFADVAVMRRHLKVHLGIMYYKCPICSKQFNRKLTMQTHALREHGAKAVESHGVTPPSHQCSQCGRQFMQLSQLTAHMKLHDKQLKCPHPGCTSLFRYQSELAVHLQTHSTERCFLCDECGYSGKSRHQLKRHQRLHAGDKRYQCSSCDYKTTLAANLRRHERVHTGSKPYKCLYCGYSCNTQENLRKHILKTRRHAGKSVYPCQLCDFATNSAQDFQRHLEVKHQHDRQTLPSVLVGMYQPDDNKKHKSDAKSTTDKPSDSSSNQTGTNNTPVSNGNNVSGAMTSLGNLSNIPGSSFQRSSNSQTPTNSIAAAATLTQQTCQNTQQQQITQQLTKQLFFAGLPTTSNSNLNLGSTQSFNIQPSIPLSLISQTLQLQQLKFSPQQQLVQQTTPNVFHSPTTNSLHPQASLISSNQNARTYQPLSLVLPQLADNLTNVTYALQLMNGTSQDAPTDLNGTFQHGKSPGMLPYLRTSENKPVTLISNAHGNFGDANGLERGNIIDLKPLVIYSSPNVVYSIEGLTLPSNLNNDIATMLMTSPLDGINDNVINNNATKQ